MPGDNSFDGLDEAYGTYEWGDGGIVHLHNLRWNPGAPRCETLLDGKRNKNDWESVDPADVADAANAFFSTRISEWDNSRNPDFSEAAEVGDKKAAKDAGLPFDDPCNITHEDFIEALQPENSSMREALVGKILRSCQYHDGHLPQADGPPSFDQPCAKVEKATRGTRRETVVCNKGFPKAVLEPKHVHIEQDGGSTSRILKLHLARNNSFCNNHHPLLLLWNRANMLRTWCTIEANSVLKLNPIVNLIWNFLFEQGRKQNPKIEIFFLPLL